METVVVNGMYVDVNHPMMSILSEDLLRELYPNNGEWGRLYLLMHGADMTGMQKTFNNLLGKKNDR